MFLQIDLHVQKPCGKEEQDAPGKLENASHSFRIIYAKSPFNYKAKHALRYQPKFCNYYYKIPFIEQLPCSQTFC